MHSPLIYGSRIGSLLLMLGLSTGLACGNAGAESGSVEDPVTESAPATMKELTLAVTGMT